MSWLTHFGLRERPFSKAIADADLWLTAPKQAAVDDIAEAIDERQTGALLVGDAGLGKSCVLRALRHQCASRPVRLTYCHNATLGRRDFYRHICRALGLNPKATAAGVFNALGDYVTELSSERIHPVFIIDEAHLLHQDVLDHLHILANHEWDASPLLTLVLAGLPDLWDRLLLRRNRSLWSRIHTRLRLPEPQPADTAAYVAHRLQRAGGQASAFDSDALAMLHEATAGGLRDVDRLATASLKAAARAGLQRVDRALLLNVVNAHKR